MDQSTVIYPYKGNSVITRNELSSYKKPWRNLKYTFLSEKNPIRNGYTLYDFNDMTFGKSKTMVTV